MESYNIYTEQLSNLVKRIVSSRDISNETKCIRSALDGQASSALVNLVDINIRREYGIFFTHGIFAKKVISPLSNILKNGPVVFDPTCGAGDLLIESAKYLPVKPTLISTLNLWGSLLYGLDLHQSLIDAAKYRLVLIAIIRGAKSNGSTINLKAIFKNIRVADLIDNFETCNKADIIITNPPYIKYKPSVTNESPRSTSMAGYIIDKIIENSKDGTKIVGVLPDVLRSGSSYVAWRNMVSRNLNYLTVKPQGRFDKNVDVDVFLLRGIIASNKKEKISSVWPDNFYVFTTNNIGDYFEVCVGPVVPHRHISEGLWHAYIHARDCPPWEQINSDRDMRKLRFSGKVFKPPFVVIRRTSSPRDTRRAIATVVSGKRSVAVENHLIILTPKSSLLRDCKSLVKTLNSNAIDDFISKRNSCRHLTVQIVKNIPFKISNK